MITAFKLFIIPKEIHFNDFKIKFLKEKENECENKGKIKMCTNKRRRRKKLTTIN